MHALSMMVITSGNCCDPLKSSCHFSSYNISSRCDDLQDLRRNKEWCVSSVNKEKTRPIVGLIGTTINHKSVLRSIQQGLPPCVTGRCSIVTSPKFCMPVKKLLVTINSRSKSRTHNQGRIARIRVRSHGIGASWDAQGQENENLQSGPTERYLPLNDGLLLDFGDGNVQGTAGPLNRPHEGLDEISSSEYQKIQDLKFSGDMWEGDSGPQVLDLQRALYWFGYLPKRTSLTAYFGLETKRALQQFQIVHGVPGTGAWGSSSRQALWKLLSEDSSQLSEGGNHLDLQQPVPPMVNRFTVGETDVGIHVSELMNSMGAQSKEFMSTLSSAPYWRQLPTNVPRDAAIFGVLVGVLIALFGLGYSVVGMFHQQDGQPVRRRVLRAHWRDDIGGTSSIRTKRHLDMFPGLDLPLVGEEDFKYRLRSKSKSNSPNGPGRTDRLILYEGQVVVGDEISSHVYPFRNGASTRPGPEKYTSPVPSKAKLSSIPVQASTDQTSQKVASNGSTSGPHEIFQENQVPTKGISNVRLRGENQSSTRSEADGLGSSTRMPVKSTSPRSMQSEQSNFRQPNVVRNVLSALFTPRGLGHSAGLEQPEKQKTGSRSAQLDARSVDKEVLNDHEQETKMSWAGRTSKLSGNSWQDKDEEKLRDHVEELRKAVQATEKNRQAAMRALAEERQRSLELQVKISRQKETAAALEEEVRVLKESHDALLASLRKKYSSSVAARAAAALLYQNWDTNFEEGSAPTLSY